MLVVGGALLYLAYVSSKNSEPLTSTDVIFEFFEKNGAPVHNKSTDVTNALVGTLGNMQIWETNAYTQYARDRDGTVQITSPLNYQILMTPSSTNL